MKLYSYYKLDCHDFVKQSCLEFIEKNWDFKSEKIYRLDRWSALGLALQAEMTAKNLPSLRAISIFCRGPNNKQIIHRDGITDDPESTVYCKTGFYIPITTQDSSLIWYNPDTGRSVLKWSDSSKNSTNRPTATLATVYDNENAEKIGEYSSSEPVIINTSIPHRAVSRLYPRAALAIRLNDNVDLFDALGV
jgi:hypothetical protein